MAPAAAMPAFTIIVCTHDRPAYLRACLAALAGPPPMDTIVVDSASPPAAAAQVAALARAHGAMLLRLEQPGLSVARNAGLAATKTPWVAYLDDDARPAPGWAAAISIAIATLPPAAAALGGPILPEWEAPLPGWWPPELVPALTVLEWQHEGRMGDGSLPPGIEPYGANIAFRVPALRSVGGFPAILGRYGHRLLSGEEAFVLRRLLAAGHGVHFIPAAIVRHSIQAGRLTPSWLLDRQFHAGLSEAILLAALGRAAEARRKAARLIPHAIIPWPGGGSALIRSRARTAFARGFLRGVLAPQPGMPA